MNRLSTSAQNNPIQHSQRKEPANLTRLALDLASTREGAKFRTPALPRAYPSPPMSGSSPPSQRAASDADDRISVSSGYPSISTPNDPYRGSSIQPSPTEPLGYSEHLARPYSYEPSERLAHAHPRPNEFPRPMSYPAQGLPGVPHGMAQQPYMSTGMSGPSQGYPVMPGQQQAPDNSPYTSPKSQRKAKGHVASACVPCKKAHLRCDAQRPCSRCLSSGKGDACVDVQHKKRGRPRLRDDRETRYDLSRPPPPHDSLPRRPLNIHPSGSPGAMGDPMGPRYLERPPGSSPYPYGGPMPVSAPVPEAVAYLTMDLEFANASETFLSALGGPQRLRNLADVVAVGERDKVTDLRNRLYAEQKRMEPNYLPPIMGRGDQILQMLGFMAEDVSRFELRYQDYLTFLIAGGSQRVYPIQLGLAKEGSFYFVVILIGLPPRELYSMSPHDHGHPAQRHPEAPMPHDPSRHLHREEVLPSRPAPGVASRIQQGQSPGLSPAGVSSYSASPNRAEFPGSGSYHTPRSEVNPSMHQPPRPSFQLPPIRTPIGQDSSGGDQTWSQRDERSNRVDIGGLIEKPEAPGRSH